MCVLNLADHQNPTAVWLTLSQKRVSVSRSIGKVHTESAQQSAALSGKRKEIQIKNTTNYTNISPVLAMTTTKKQRSKPGGAFHWKRLTAWAGFSHTLTHTRILHASFPWGVDSVGARCCRYNTICDTRPPGHGCYGDPFLPSMVPDIKPRVKLCSENPSCKSVALTPRRTTNFIGLAKRISGEITLPTFPSHAQWPISRQGREVRYACIFTFTASTRCQY